jgi:hypothetical protein
LPNVCRPNVSRRNVCRPNVSRRNVCRPNVSRPNVCRQNGFDETTCSQNLKPVIETTLTLMCLRLHDSDFCIFTASEKMNFNKGANIIKLFTAVSHKISNKLKRLSPASLFSLVSCLWVRPGAYPLPGHILF